MLVGKTDYLYWNHVILTSAGYFEIYSSFIYLFICRFKHWGLSRWHESSKLYGTGWNEFTTESIWKICPCYRQRRISQCSNKKNIIGGSRKQEILNCLSDNNLPANPKLTKPELYIFEENKFRFPTKYKLDNILHQHGHCVLRLPSYHPELNPTEKSGR